MDQLPLHDRPYFFKYMTESTARKVIASKSFRWSTPLLFNDPFDHQTGLTFPFTGEDLAKGIKAVFEDVVINGTKFAPICRRPFGDFLKSARLHRSAINNADGMKVLDEVISEIGRTFSETKGRFNAEITDFLTHSRVLCLSETGDNVVMWSHYADSHKGVVFKLRKLEAEDHHFLAARRVDYTTDPINYFSLREYVDNLTGVSEHDPAPIIWQIAYRKHPDWAYEREWRLHRPLLDAAKGAGYEDISEKATLFEAVYLGCCLPDASATEMCELLGEHLPQASIFRAYKAQTGSTLEFRRIK